MPVLLDLSRGAAALQVARTLRTVRSSTRMVVVGDARRPDLTPEAVLAGMADVFARPLGGRRVVNAIEREQRYESRQFGGSLHAHGDDLYTHSPAMREVMTLVARASTMREGVLIRGEQGTGRQVAARVIPAPQNGTAGAFVMIDCAAFDSASLDIHLFGEAARSSNGDQTPHGLERISIHGHLHAALNGTLSLHNVADAATSGQA